jgi:cardiolipin synthase
LAIAILPLAGCLFFVIFGTMPMNRKDWRLAMMSQAKYNKFEDYSFSKSFVKNNTESSNLFSYSYRNELKPIYHRNHVEAIPSNTKSYSEVIRLIRSAKDFIHMETYILRDGFFLRTLIAELILKAKSGVKVRFLYD